jgi:hypothetical protein
MKISNKELISVLPLLYYGTYHFNSQTPQNMCLKVISQQLQVSSSKIKHILKKLLCKKDMDNAC